MAVFVCLATRLTPLGVAWAVRFQRLELMRFHPRVGDTICGVDTAWVGCL